MTPETERGNPWLTAFMLVVLAELVLLGSGRLLQLGPLTLRMWLYLACLASAALLVVRRGQIDREIALLGLGFVALTAGSSAIGLLNHAPLRQVAEDVKPLMFFPMIFFFGAVIRDVDQTRSIATLIRVCSLLLAIGYIGIWVLVFAGVLPFSLIYGIVNSTGEFFFRGEMGTFYKGFLYLGVGLCFFVAGGRWSKLAVVILSLAIVLTFTRGLMLAAALMIVLAVLLRERSVLRLPLYGALMVGSLVAVWPWLTKTFANRSMADAGRMVDVQVVEQSATWSSILVGYGLGSGVGDETRIEASYLQILHQQGIIGLLFWLSITALLTRDYWQAARRGRQTEALPFFLASLFVFVESATNPFLTNPIGMSIVLVSLVALKRLATAEPVSGSGVPVTVIPPRHA